MEYTYQYASLVLDGNGAAESKGPIGIKPDGTQPFTIDAWVRPEDVYERRMIISQSNGFCMGIDNKRLFFYIPGYPSVYSSTPDGVFVNGEWVHLCAVYNTSAITLYLNGVSDTFAAVGGSGVYKEAPFIFGDNFHGLIRQVRIFNCALSSDQVNAYLMETDLSNEEYKNSLAAYFDFSNLPVSERITGQQISLKHTAELRLFSTGAIFAGNSFFTVDGEPHINPAGKGNDSYTVQAWVFMQPNEYNSRQTIFANGDVNGSAGMSLYIEREKDAYYVKALRDAGINGDDIVISSAPVKTSQWINIAVTYAVDTMKLYVDGKLSSSLEGLFPISATLINKQPRIGSEVIENNVSGQDWFTGCISRLDVWQRELSADEIALYAGEAPNIDADGLLACYIFHQMDASNVCSGQLLGMRNSVTFGEVSVKASKKLLFSEDERRPEEFIEPLEMWQLAQFRNQALGNDVEDGDSTLTYTVTSHVLGDMIYFVAHDQDSSYTICYGKASEIDSVTAWYVGLILIVVGGVLSLVFGVKIKGAGSSLMKIIYQVAQNPLFRTVVSGTISIITIAEIFKILYNSGVLKDLLWAALSDYSYWKVLCVIAKIVLLAMASAMGGWLVYASLLASLVIEIVNHITKYPGHSEDDEEKKKVPKIDVASISFHGVYGQDDTPTVALSNNNLKDINPPEWTSNFTGVISCAVEDAANHAAYMLDVVEQKYKNEIKIQATFQSAEIEPFTAMIRCCDTSGLFGISDPVLVEMVGGHSKKIDIPFRNHTLQLNGVKYVETTFLWQMIDGDEFASLRSTQHSFYFILNKPHAPWDNKRLWVGALKNACTWAEGATTAEAAASAIVETVYNNLRLEYDFDNKFVSYDDTFQLTCFLEHLDSPEMKSKVNCTDCAAICATFANILGCWLSQKRMKNTDRPLYGFDCNKIKPIGYKLSDGLDEFDGFSYHDVCMMEPEPMDRNKNEYKVYDACLEVNGHNPPDGEETEFLLPKGMQFSLYGDKDEVDYNQIPPNDSYRERLTPNTEEGRCSCKYDDEKNEDPNFIVKKIQ